MVVVVVVMVVVVTRTSLHSNRVVGAAASEMTFSYKPDLELLKSHSQSYENVIFQTKTPLLWLILAENLPLKTVTASQHLRGAPINRYHNNNNSISS